MKLIIAIVQKEDTNDVCKALNKEHFRVTKLATQGSFLMTGNTTLLIGDEDEKVPKILEIIKEHSKQRKEYIPSVSPTGGQLMFSAPLEIIVGGATVFILDVAQFEKF